MINSLKYFVNYIFTLRGQSRNILSDVDKVCKSGQGNIILGLVPVYSVRLTDSYWKPLTRLKSTRQSCEHIPIKAIIQDLYKMIWGRIESILDVNELDLCGIKFFTIWVHQKPFFLLHSETTKQ